MNNFLLSYGELSLKKGNKKHFIKKIKKNIKQQAKRENINFKFEPLYGKLLFKSKSDKKKVENFLKNIIGLSKIVPVTIIKRDMESLKEKIIPIIETQYNKNDTLKFAVSTNRAEKKFPYNSMEVNKIIGKIINDYFPNFTVNLDNPDLDINIDIRSKNIYVSHKEFEGQRGLPEGTEGTGLLLLSGGIDSPVAGYLSLKRGLSLDFVYFNTPPFTSKLALEKVKKLANRIKKYSFRKKLYFYNVNITDLQKEIIEKCEKKNSTIILRAVMIAIANKIAEKKQYDAIITGDSLGQVASQTIESLSTASKFSEKLILRPLIGYNKLNVIKIAKNIKTYKISIEPHQDCCSIFVPKHPNLKPKYKFIKKDFDKLNIGNFFDNFNSNIDKIGI